uniref:MHD1 domain-containing protein n=1 Tax=Timema monikensis TaxID=170555 RepID=A0A7R9E951_9NEOP|nr:unnamed protein product [Timema monikensis]
MRKIFLIQLQNQLAFAWFSDLLVEHAEIFWSLFAVDMNQVLAEQPPDTWDSFPLFQILNDYLRTDDNLKNGKFHQHLRDTFAPLVVRYVDLMESSIGQSIHKGFEKERWEIKGNGCATSEDLFWKLDALQSFIRDLHWPDAEFRQHLEQRRQATQFKGESVKLLPNNDNKTNGVASMIDNSFGNFGYGETDMLLHADNSVAQNKNNYELLHLTCAEEI